MKRRNPNWGSPRIGQQIALAFGVAIDKDMVRRILSVQAGLRFARSLLAHRSGPYEGQFVELRSVPLRIGNPENPLGSGRDGPLYASDHRVWRAPWRSRRRGAVPDVSASDSRSTSDKIPQLGSRSAIQVPSMASQSSSTRGEGNQDGSLRAAFPSLRRTTDRHRSTRVFGQDSILDHGRLGDEATRLPTLL